ncbi:MAG TPA: LLM class flavin-dependent oxidoreductase [Stellaceae bacterium]|nr:LLM class flavin-dependent oxidoreductase [Stellaceae bacterium]
MEVGFFFWPFTPALVERMAQAAERGGWDMAGVADTPGNAMDPWVAATMLALRTKGPRLALCVTNIASRHPAATAAAIASLDLLAPGRAVLGLGLGHSGTANLGLARSTPAELADGAQYIRALLSGSAARWRDGGEARLTWASGAPSIFLAASGPKALAAAGRVADGVFVNYGIDGAALAYSEQAVRQAVAASGRDPDKVEIWQVAALDCSEDEAAARRRIGAILAFMAAGYIFGSGDLAARGVPRELHAPIAELRRRYSTRPGAADAALVDELGLFDYLARRFAVWGTPETCRTRLEEAERAGLRRVMFTVSLAADPAATVELFGERVLPALR